MTYIPKNKVHIPSEWSGKQAMAIWEFLEEIATVIWDVHERGILDAMHIDNSLLERAARGDNHDCMDEDDIPF